MKTGKSWVLAASLALAAGMAWADPARLSNISTRMQVLAGDEVMIGGFVIGGATDKTVVVRARGPSLVPFGITNALANPQLQLVRSSDQATLATNDDWKSAANSADLTASGFAPADDLEAALLVTLPPGAYTAIVSGVAGGTGVAIVEVFEVDGPAIPLVNISTRGRVLTANDVMIGGFVVQGSGPQTVVVRARGPSLTQAGVPNALADPTLRLVRSSDQVTLATNDNWPSAGNALAISATGLAPSENLESAILASLPPGAYTAIVSGVGDTTGVGIVEVFAVADTQPPTVESTSPAHTADHMSVLVPVAVTFSEAIDPATITTATFTLTGPAGPVAGALSVVGNVATLTPSARLVTETAYTGNVSTGVRDMAGNALAAGYAFTFTTRVDEPPPIVAGCPAPEPGSQLRRLEWGPPLIVKRESGVITSYRVAQSQTGRRSVAFQQGQTGLTPPSATTEFTVSRCPGVIEPGLPAACQLTSTNPNNLTITAVNSGPAGFGDCLAPNSEQHYVNVRWTFANCAMGVGECGNSLTWLEGGY